MQSLQDHISFGQIWPSLNGSAMVSFLRPVPLYLMLFISQLQVTSAGPPRREKPQKTLAISSSSVVGSRACNWEVTGSEGVMR